MLNFYMLDSEAREKILQEIKNNCSKDIGDLKDTYNIKFLESGSEEAVCTVFEKVHKKLGIENIKKVDNDPILSKPTAGKLGPGDYVGERKGKKVRIEIEFHLPSFFTHRKGIRDMIDVIVALDEGRGISKEKREELKKERKEVILINDCLESNYIRRGEFWDFLYTKDEEFRNIADKVLFNHVGNLMDDLAE